MRCRSQRDTLAAAAIVLTALLEAEDPVPRHELVQAIQSQFPHWRDSGRRWREARAYLVAQGYPVVSDGKKGFILDALSKAYQDDIRRREHRIISEAIDLARLKKISPALLTHQLSLDFGLEEASA